MTAAEPTRIDPAAGMTITAWDFSADQDVPAVIAVADFTSGGLWFGDLAEACGSRIRIVAPDLRGRAASLASPPAASLDDHVADVVGLADRLGIGSFSLVGHGTGAAVALAVAAIALTRVRAVTVLDGPPMLSRREDWISAAAGSDPGIDRLQRTWAHRNAAVSDGRSSGRLPAQGLSRALRRAVDAEVAGSGFGWQPRLNPTSLRRDWELLRAWIPSRLDGLKATTFRAGSGHRADDPPLELHPLEGPSHLLDTTHTGLLCEPEPLRAIARHLSPQITD